jgi:hypothetical protein
MAGLTQPCRGFDPAERLLDTLTQALADRIARMAGGPRIDGRTPASIVLCHMRGNAQA